MLAIPPYLQCIHQGGQVAAIDGGCSIGQVPVLRCDHFQSLVLLRKCNSLPDPQYQELRVCQGCASQQRPDAGPQFSFSEPRPEPRLERVLLPQATAKERRDLVKARIAQVRTEEREQLAQRRYREWQAGEHPPIAAMTEIVDATLGGRAPKFQPSLLLHDGRWFLAYRAGWDRGEIWLAELEPNWRPKWTRRIPIPPAAGIKGYEDPRLFTFQGRLHVSYNSWTGSVAKMLYSEITVHAEHVRQFAPQVSAAGQWEKNWAFFEAGGRLNAVYDADVQHVLEFDADGQVARDHRAAWPAASGRDKWQWGRLRGGAPPVRVGDEFYHFFHATLDGPPRMYTLGLHTFSAEPPFTPRRFAAWPLLAPDPADHRGVTPPMVVFPCGAVRHAGQWLISVGWFDAACRIYAFDEMEVEQHLAPRHRTPPAHFRSRPGIIDAQVIKDVITDNEYRLPLAFAADDQILDLGGHIGTFAVSCLERGAGKVTSVEPVEENYQVLAENLSPYGARWQGVQAAIASAAEQAAGRTVWERDQSTLVVRGVYQYAPGHAAGWSTQQLDQQVYATRLASVVTIRQLMAEQPGRLRLVKVDCEGPEFDLILADGDDWLERTDAICGEYHTIYGQGRTEAELLAALEAAGFSVESQVLTHDRGLFFAWRHGFAFLNSRRSAGRG